MHLVSEQTCATNRGQGETVAKPCTWLLKTNKDILCTVKILLHFMAYQVCKSSPGVFFLFPVLAIASQLTVISC